MKLQFAITFFLLLFFAHDTFAQNNTIFYSRSPMYVDLPEGETKGSTKESTVLHIEGSAEFSNGAIIKIPGRMELTGDFINDKTTISSLGGGTSEVLLFDKGLQTDKDEGVVAFIGRDVKQLIRRSDRLTKKNDGGLDDEDQKSWYYLNFPTIRVEQLIKSPFYIKDNNVYKAPSLDPRKYNYVAVDSSAAIMVDHLVVPNYNRFAVEGGYSKFNPREMNIGQALIKKAYYSSANGDEFEDDSPVPSDLTGNAAYYSQVNLSLYDYKAPDSENPEGVNYDVFGANHANTKGDETMRNALGQNYMLGFTPPFRSLGADYFFYHMLTTPTKDGYNSEGYNILDPYKRLIPGKGYFISMDVTDADHKENINPRWEHDMGEDIGDQHRARGGFSFNRGVMADYLYPGYSPDSNQKGFSRFTYLGSLLEDPERKEPELEGRDRKEIMNDERFNLDDVVVSLEPGFNFLGNPFMAPIDLSPLLGWFLTYPGDGQFYDFRPTADFDIDEEALRNGFDISEFFSPDPTDGSKSVYASSAYVNTEIYPRMLRTKVWLINQATAQYMPSDGLTHFRARFGYISRDAGGTDVIDMRDNVIVENEDQFQLKSGETGTLSPPYLIAPMQMFGVQASGPFQIRLDKRLRSFGFTDYRKSSDVDKYEKMYDASMKDVLVVELVSPLERSTDRTAVVLRERAKSSYQGDTYDTRKGISKAMETYQDVILADGKNRTYPAASTSLVYTKSTDGESLLGNGLPMNTKEVPLYITPPATEQTMTMNFLNVDRLKSVPNVWLVDRYENKTVKIERGTSYQFTSGPSDLNDKNNRFILRFWGEDEDIVKEESNITCYYNTSVLHIGGLTESDINSSLTIYDMQGRLIAKTRITNAPSMEYVKPLSLGTYILKIEGDRNFTSKFVNLSR